MSYLAMYEVSSAGHSTHNVFVCCISDCYFVCQRVDDMPAKNAQIAAEAAERKAKPAK